MSGQERRTLQFAHCLSWPPVAPHPSQVTIELAVEGTSKLRALANLILPCKIDFPGARRGSREAARSTRRSNGLLSPPASGSAWSWHSADRAHAWAQGKERGAEGHTEG